MDFECKVYKDFRKLKKEEPKLANAIMEEVGNGKWMNEEIIVYPDVEEYAKYELSVGWYINCGFDKNNYRGAPNPFDYIDMKAFGKALTSSWDKSCHMQVDGKILTTFFGW